MNSSKMKKTEMRLYKDSAINYEDPRESQETNYNDYQSKRMSVE